MIGLLSFTNLHAQVEIEFVIGEEDGATALVFGNIVDIAVDSIGRIYVLDGHAREVRVFDFAGRYVQTVGRRGSGPGEFQEPRAMVVQGDRLLVLDAANPRITRYVVADSLEYFDDQRTPFPAYDLCVSGDRLLVLGYNEDRFVHELSMEGLRRIHSFAESTFEQPMLRRRAFRNMECYGSTVMLFAGEWGNLASYHVTGQVFQELQVSEFHPIKIESVFGGGLSFSVPESGWFHWMLGAFPKADTIIVQVGRVDPTSGLSPKETPDVTWIGFAPDLTELWRRADGFRVIIANHQRLYGVSTDPYPRVVVARY